MMVVIVLHMDNWYDMYMNANGTLFIILFAVVFGLVVQHVALIDDNRQVDIWCCSKSIFWTNHRAYSCIQPVSDCCLRQLQRQLTHKETKRGSRSNHVLAQHADRALVAWTESRHNILEVSMVHGKIQGINAYLMRLMLPKTKPIHKPTVPPMAAPIFIFSKVEGSMLVCVDYNIARVKWCEKM